VNENLWGISVRSGGGRASNNHLRDLCSKLSSFTPRATATLVGELQAAHHLIVRVRRSALSIWLLLCFGR
jgi:hypothetical protein